MTRRTHIPPCEGQNWHQLTVKSAGELVKFSFIRNGDAANWDGTPAAARRVAYLLNQAADRVEGLVVSQDDEGYDVREPGE